MVLFNLLIGIKNSVEIIFSCNLEILENLTISDIISFSAYQFLCTFVQ